MLIEIAGGILLALAVLWLLKWAVMLLFVLPAEHRAAARRSENRRSVLEADAERGAQDRKNEDAYARLQTQYDQRVTP